MIVDDNEDSTLLDLVFLPAKVASSLVSSLVRPRVPATPYRLSALAPGSLISGQSTRSLNGIPVQTHAGK
jgi:hypothetical protein